MRSQRDTATSFNVPWIVEMYANFGWTGVMIGMAIVGALFAWLEAKFSRSDMTALELIVGLTITFDLCYQESNFSLMIGARLLLSLCLYLIFDLALGHRTEEAPKLAALYGTVLAPTAPYGEIERYG
jgi:hypothetical protein